MEYFLVSGLLLIVMAMSVKTGKLSIPAALAGGLTGFLVFGGGGYAGLLMLSAFFVLGIWATSHGKDIKAAITISSRPAKGTRVSLLMPLTQNT